jgi:NADH-quinone oxidoreductase subunit I
MPGRVIVVQRRRKLAFWERLHLPMISRLLAGPLASLSSVRSSGRDSESVASGDFSEAFRGMPVLVAREDGRPRCVACGLCEFACPPRCIAITPGEGEGGVQEPVCFEIDMGRCMFCGLCEEACPEEAIVMSPHVQIAASDRESLVFGQRELLVPAELVAARLARLRADRERACEGAER